MIQQLISCACLVYRTVSSSWLHTVTDQLWSVVLAVLDCTCSNWSVVQAAICCAYNIAIDQLCFLHAMDCIRSNQMCRQCYEQEIAACATDQLLHVQPTSARTTNWSLAAMYTPSHRSTTVYLHRLISYCMQPTTGYAQLINYCNVQWIAACSSDRLL